MSDGQHPMSDQAAAYALDGLSAAERARFEVHLRDCSECPRLVGEYRDVLGLMPRALPPQAPPPGARAALLARARLGQTGPAPREVSADPTPIHPADPRDRQPERVSPIVRLLRPLRWAAVAAAMVGLLLWNLQLQDRVHRLEHQEDIERLARLPDGRIIPLVGTGAPAASARLFLSSDGDQAALAIDGLPPLARARVYQLWFARPGQPTITGGTFVVHDGQDLAAVRIPAPLDQVSAIAVTEEPAPGSPSPTGEHLLDGRP